MAVLIDETTVYVIQGLTGKEGQRAAEWMKNGGAKIAAGVTPGKGGQTVLNIPIYNTVAEAVAAHPEISASSIYAPPQFVKEAAVESLEAGVPFIHIIAENVPTRDIVEILERAQTSGTRVLGPSSVGVACPTSVVGSLGGGTFDGFYFADDQHPGVAVISKSGGMANTLVHVLSAAGIRQSTVIGIGGDRVVGTTYADILPDLLEDDQTQAIVILGEIGGSYEEDVASAVTAAQHKKPVVAYISGIFAETLPKGVSFGHAGAIVDAEVGTRKSKIEALSAAGVIIASDPQDIVKQLENIVQL
ncbi:MAG: CoA-binding protein [Pseudomonadales bacterium]|nr:CoA-binding protein [Candidatus Woesebacteria bacterium]MCB9801270.1 CoA-binding protein [Pseudomonadales bacterium]